MEEQIHFDRAVAGVGPAASFAEKWCTDNPKEQIGFIPYAEGGSFIDEFRHTLGQIPFLIGGLGDYLGKTAFGAHCTEYELGNCQLYKFATKRKNAILLREASCMRILMVSISMRNHKKIWTKIL